MSEDALTLERIEAEVQHLDPHLARTEDSYRAAVVLLALVSLTPPPTVQRLVAFTGFDPAWVERIVGTLRTNGILADDGTLAVEWFDKDGGIAFWMDVCVALGLMERRQPMSEPLRDRLAALIDQTIQRVAELPNRTSPDDWPEAMLVTSDELRQILSEELAALRAAPEAAEDRPPTGWTGQERVLWNLLLDAGVTVAEADTMVQVAVATLRPKAEAARPAAPEGP